MEWVLLYAVTLFAAALISERADRSVLSTAVLFLAVGVAAGGWLFAVDTSQTAALVGRIADLALFAVLFTDGMRLNLRQPKGTWAPPVRALGIGMPAVFLITGVFAHYVGGLPWLEALLVGAILSPTDPVFASAIVGHPRIPAPLRRLLNVESGLNDGLALPLVFVLLALTRGEPVPLAGQLLELGGGIAVGLAIAGAALWLLRRPYFAPSVRYKALDAFAVGAIIYATAILMHANEYLAAFSAGVLIRFFAPDVVKNFWPFGERLVEMLKLAALLVFGAALGERGLPQGLVIATTFAILAIVVARPVSILIALAGSRVPWRERFVAGWFGPKGFASVVYGLIALRAGLPAADRVFALLAVTIALSIVAHSSTDVLIARRFSGETP